MPSKSKRESLPFEPKSSKRSQEQPINASFDTTSGLTEPPASKASDYSSTSVEPKNDAGIPEAVSRRMIRRMTVFAGVPTFLGMSSFVIAYILLTQHIVEFPNVAVLIVSLSFFGLGTLGLSYGVLSASWQEDTEGSLLGFGEFSVNFQRLIQGLRKSKQSSASD